VRRPKNRYKRALGAASREWKN